MEKEIIAKTFKSIQEEICLRLESVDGKETFFIDRWEREGGGGGESRILQGGQVFEKAGVNFSEVLGPVSEKMASSFKFPIGNFYATGVSIVIHPESPFVPIIHMNIRYFELEGHSWWFGGGIDLTPIYIDMEEAKLFHSALKSTCDAYHLNYYEKFKAWADDYFFIPHRNETRGIGGIFFDRLTGPSSEKEGLFDFVCAVGKTFGPLYAEIVQRKQHKAYDKTQKNWQSLRRSRYVEFNLVYDKGTKFGLDSDGRTESILMSLPPHAEWPYNFKPPLGSPEADTQALLVKNKAWIE
jgi:coproporphyrinogen III oxidase